MHVAAVASGAPNYQLQQDDTHRLVPARYSEDGASVLARLISDPQHLHDLFQLEGATNERLLGEANLLPGITVHELVFGIPNWHIVNAAFTHARPEGSRFNSADRGAWYCAFTLETAQTEVAFHFAQSLREVNWEESETATYREYLADFRGGFTTFGRVQNMRVPRSGELCRVATTGWRTLEPGIGRSDLPQCAPSWRHMPRLLPPRAGRQRPPWLGGHT